MTVTPKFLFVDDAFAPGGDADHYRLLLAKADELQIEPMLPNRTVLLAAEADLPPDIAGFILDINLKDRVPPGGERFQGTGAGLAQDIRLLQASDGPEGQRPRPIVRLCAAQVFQRYLAGDDSTADIFDLGYAKETIADIVGAARRQIAALPDLYEALIAIAGDLTKAPDLLGLDANQYASLHSSFRSALEVELKRKPHEAANFLIRHFLEAPGLLISEEMLALRLGIDRSRSPEWEATKQRFSDAAYKGRAQTGFPRWWAGHVLAIWTSFSETPLYQLTAADRVALLLHDGLGGLAPLVADPRSPGDRPWLLSQSDDPHLRLPTDPDHGYPINLPTKPWLDEAIWCREQARRDRRSPMLSIDTQARLARDLKRGTVV